MRVFIFLFCLSAFSISPEKGFGQTAAVVIDANKKVSADEVFDLIMNQTDYKFIYQEGIFKNVPKIELTKGTISTKNLLEKTLSVGDFDFEYNANKTIIIKAKPTKKSIVQNREIIGTIKDEKGLEMAGASITVEGTNRGVVANFDGFFKIVLKEGENVIVISSLGYKTERIVVGNQTNFTITLKEDFAQLEEVVLIGYGTQKRENVTGAVSSVKTSDIVQASTGSVGFDRSLGGLVKGVSVSQSSGRPGSPVSIQIRGITSPLSGIGKLNQPLFVIDGVPFNIDGLNGANPLLTLNPDDIESFDVLKDAAATSIYGSRGANGVIIVQTKKGKRNQDTKVNFSYSTTLATPIKKVDVLNAKQYRNFYDMLIKNSVNAMNAGQIDPFFAFDLDNIGMVDLDFDTFEVTYNGLRDEYFGDADTDWNDLVFRKLAVTKQTNVGITGGSENSNYSLRVGFLDQEGLTINDGIKQYTLGLSMDTNLSKKVKAGGTVNLSHVDTKSGEDDILGQYTVNSSIARARPDLPAYDDNGNLLGQPDYAYGSFQTLEPNPLMRLKNKTKNQSYNFIGNTYLEYEPIRKLKLKADVNTALFYADNSTFIPKITQTDLIFAPNESFLAESSNLVSNVTTNLTANYSFKINNNNFSALVGAAWDRTNFRNKDQFFVGFPDDDILINGSSAQNVGTYRSNRLETGLNSMFSRLTYDYKNKYNATINFRTDTSSKFGPENKRAYFPSVSTSWNISNEDFLADSEKINTLRLRLSAGKVGSTNTADFAYLQFFKSDSDDLYNGNSAVVPSNVFPNVNIGWEKTSEINAGLDFAFFNSRLRGGIDVYSRKTTDALANTPIPQELGSNTYFSNFVDISNRGLEISLGGDIIKTEDFSWTTNINWSLNRNKLIKIKGAEINPFSLDYFVEGQPVGTIKGYKVVKIIQNQTEIDDLNAASPTGLYDLSSTGVGDYLYEDINGDGEISVADRTVIGNIQPDFFGGISNTFTYKNFGLTALFQYSVGGERTWSNIPFGTLNILGENKYSEYALNTWTPETPDARYARALYFDPSGSSRISDRYLYDTSYLRLKNLQFFYNFDSLLMKKIGLTNAKLMLTATNLMTWTNWPGMDPETFSERGGIVDQVNNEDPYPLSKSVSFGVQFQF
ncbi:SusC/RagA family TonB-linked outer membrane protein [Flavobacterium ardleyense]|uniref:SusC/RagA family TonB-linked outer membrane protein n=1 Tax=Flavobacterium ardleyense TaxID=2038737 RepID=A0ABW5Z4N6_9FLAO